MLTWTAPGLGFEVDTLSSLGMGVELRAWCSPVSAWLGHNKFYPPYEAHLCILFQHLYYQLFHSLYSGLSDASRISACICASLCSMVCDVACA